MPNLIISTPFDTFMQSANQVAMRTNIGLGNVDNTSDANKPVSTAQQTALNLKMTTTDFTAGNYPFPSTVDARIAVLSGTLAAINAITLEAGELAVITDQPQGRLIRIGDGSTAGGLPFAALEKALNLSNGAFPIMLYVKNVTVLTSGAPADIATITLPPGITQYAVSFGNNVISGGWRSIAETAAGTLAGAAFTLRDTAAGAGSLVYASMTGPSGAGVSTGAAGASGTVVYTSQTLYVRQTGDSANAGTCSFYIWIVPLP